MGSVHRRGMNDIGDLVAVYAAVVSSAVAIVQLRSHQRRLFVSVITYAQPGEESPLNRRVSIQIANYGDRPIWLNHIFLYSTKEHVDVNNVRKTLEPDAQPFIWELDTSGIVLSTPAAPRLTAASVVYLGGRVDLDLRRAWRDFPDQVPKDVDNRGVLSHLIERLRRPSSIV